MCNKGYCKLYRTSRDTHPITTPRCECTSGFTDDAANGPLAVMAERREQDWMRHGRGAGEGRLENTSLQGKENIYLSPVPAMWGKNATHEG